MNYKKFYSFTLAKNQKNCTAEIPLTDKGFFTNGGNTSDRQGNFDREVKK